MVNDQWSWQFGESDEATAFHVTVKCVHCAAKGAWSLPSKRIVDDYSKCDDDDDDVDE